jgi:hypothetical protein
MNTRGLSMRLFKFALGLALVVAAVATPAYAAVPEIGPGEAVSAVTLLAGGYLILSARFRSRK